LQLSDFLLYKIRLRIGRYLYRVYGLLDLGSLAVELSGQLRNCLFEFILDLLYLSFVDVGENALEFGHPRVLIDR
jgi:hypothetical protein